MFLEVLTAMFKIWRIGKQRQRTIVLATIIFVITAIIFVVIGNINLISKRLSEIIAGIFGICGAIFTLGILAYQKSYEETKKEKELEEVKKRIQENPEETQAAWELAREKLESYLNRNLKQVRSVFYLTVFVMLVGFTLIGYGVIKLFDDPNTLKASILSAASGVIVNFIGATFLIMFRSTMSQAKDYVSILERINAVGMSVQILETLDDEETKLKQETTAEIAKQLLVLYTPITNKE